MLTRPAFTAMFRADSLLDLRLARASRRHWLKTLGGAASLGAASFLLPAATREAFAQPVFSDYPFRLGVASGDPSPDGFVIWTRLMPRPLDIEANYGMPRQPVEVQWEVARDDAFRDIAARGTAVAHPDLGHSVHVEVAGLEPARPYWYRFSAGRERSFTGRARTLPAPGSAVARVRLAVAGCQNYEQGLYTAHQHLAREELDFVYCYGDYIYEYRGREVYQDWAQGIVASVRRSTGDETHSLDDYRRRYAEYKMDPALMRAHAAHPWFCTWDDHEIDDNWADGIPADGTPPELFRLRRIMATQAFYEMMPLHKASFPVGERILLNRRARWGDLLSVHFLDTRSHRSDQPCGDRWGAEVCEGVRDPQATMLGAAQEQWLYEGLAQGGGAAGTTWQAIAQQIMLSDFQRDVQQERINVDAWAGYAVPRERLLRTVQQRGWKNLVVLTGDEHQHYALDIKLQGGASSAPVLLSEFVASSMSSGGDGSPVGRGGPALLARNPHCQLYNAQRGYLVCDVTPERWVTEFRVVDQVSRPGGQLSTAGKLAVVAGRSGLSAA
jgi:alkaline phosphatase D